MHVNCKQSLEHRNSHAFQVQFFFFKQWFSQQVDLMSDGSHVSLSMLAYSLKLFESASFMIHDTSAKFCPTRSFRPTDQTPIPTQQHIHLQNGGCSWRSRRQLAGPEVEKGGKRSAGPLLHRPAQCHGSGPPCSPIPDASGTTSSFHIRNQNMHSDCL